MNYLDNIMINGIEYLLTDGSGTYASSTVSQNETTDTIGFDLIDVESDVDTDVPGYYEVIYSFDDTEFGTGTGKARLYVVVTEGRSGLR